MDGRHPPDYLVLEDLINKIKLRTFDLEDLYAQYHQQWAVYHLDQLALVVAGEIVDKHDLFDKELYQSISEISFMLEGDISLRMLLLHKWIPKLRDLSNFDHDQVFSILHKYEFLKLVIPEIREILIPLLRDSKDAIPWALVLECNLMDSIDLLQETISETAPDLTDELLNIPYYEKIALVCLKVWAPTAAASQLANINLHSWSRFGLSEQDACDVFSSALATKWPLGEMITRYTVLSEFGLDPTATLERAMVYTLNCINAEMDGSGATPKLSYPTTQISLDELLLNWSAGIGIVAKVDVHDRRKYRLILHDKCIVVTLKDNLFWIDQSPIDLEQLENIVRG